MRSKGTILLILCLLIVFANNLSAVDNPADWSFSLESTGDDISWKSDSRVNWGYPVYDFNSVITQFELNLETDGWTDYSAAVDTAHASAGYDGLPVDVFNRAYDSNGITANIGIWVDEDGYGHLSMTNIAFGDVNAQNVLGVRFSGTLEVTGLKLLWEDDFTGYGEDVALDSTDDWSAWTSDYGSFKVGSNFGNRVLYKNDWWGQTVPHLATVETVSDVYDYQDVRFKVEGYRYEETVADDGNPINTQWYLMGRRTSTQSVRVKAAWGPYSENIWMRIEDSTGYTDGDYFVAEHDPNLPIILELDFDGNKVTGRVSHAGMSVSTSYTTTVTEPGKPGMAGIFRYGYAYGYFDDFAIVSGSPVPPSECGDQGTVYLEGDINKDCKVDMLDMLEIIDGWLNCSDPQDGRCN